MPTGYTADVADGTVTDFRTFALRCARAFGATILQRDDPANDPPKHREVSDYYLTRVEKAEADAARYAAMTVYEASAFAEAEYQEECVRRASYRLERAKQRANYEAMLQEVEGWEPPTPDHEEMKRFMVKQISESIDFDCAWSPYHEPPDRIDAAPWLTKKRADAKREVISAAQALDDERERCRKANAWIDALYASLPDAALAVTAPHPPRPR